ncbi:MAG TPA: hypothetical protein VHN77_05880 [Phycisphaerales bacterium]|nr:hypothetical protein [Phycisphaerales bacterium]
MAVEERVFDWRRALARSLLMGLFLWIAFILVGAFMTDGDELRRPGFWRLSGLLFAISTSVFFSWKLVRRVS